MPLKTQREKRDRIWELIEPTPYGYSQMIARLLFYLNDEQLDELIRRMGGDEDAA